jgi:hypothetical protein
MRILFTRHVPSLHSGAIMNDYQSDCLFHGLRTLGHQVVDSPKLTYMYDNYPHVAQLYGKGFTLYGLLPDVAVDRDDIENRIRHHEFDVVVISRVSALCAHLDVILQHYAPHELVVLDGEDDCDIRHAWLSRSVYFKRECVSMSPQVHPIHFAIPADKFQPPGVKTQPLAHCDPRDRRTYVFDREQDYVRDMNASLFGITMKKAGWDCMRHLELVAAGCMPLFLDIDHCPPRTCTHLPKLALSAMMSLVSRHVPGWFMQDPGQQLYENLWNQTVTHLQQHGTTQALAHNWLKTVQAAGELLLV